MDTQTITLELPNVIYRSAHQMAEATQRPLEVVLQESIAVALPPLDDVPADEVVELAAMAFLNDASLWQEARSMLAADQQVALQALLDRQEAGELHPEEESRLQELLDAYGKLTVRKAHAWLLLARRGYRVPMQA
ncbi:MAG: hypothetical protein GY759_06935 [Chloroflexi bacterium]|nr:hypothetical protein [Chloroflexota bacterium]